MTTRPSPPPSDKGMQCTVKVFARIRPFSAAELKSPDTCKTLLQVNANEIRVPSVTSSSTTTATTTSSSQGNGGGGTVGASGALVAPKMRTFHFDMCFSGLQDRMQRASQQDIYAHIGPSLVECSKSGYNGCLLAYGQTGSGKTHTVMGPPPPLRVSPSGTATPMTTTAAATFSPTTAETPLAELVEDGESDNFRDSEGILPRLIRDIFTLTTTSAASSSKRGEDSNASRTTTSFRVFVRYFEVYCEKVYDLLSPKTPEVTVRTLKGTALLDGIQEELVTSAESALAIMKCGDRRRTVAATLKNERSSRSHAVFQIICHKDVCTTAASAMSDSSQYPNSCATEADEQAISSPSSPPTVSSTISTLSLVDLAGSERQRQSGAEGTQFKEMVNINLSLSTLRRVVQVLHDNSIRAASSSSRAGGGITQAPIRESMLTSVLAPCFGGNSKTLMIVAISPSSKDVSDTISTLEFGSVARHVVNKVTVNEDANQALLRSMSEEIARLKAKLEERQRMSMCRMSRSHFAAALAEAARVEAEAATATTASGTTMESVSRRSIGVCTSVSYFNNNNNNGQEGAAQQQREDDDHDAETIRDLQQCVEESSRVHRAMQDEIVRHASYNVALQRQLEERDIVMCALRRQVRDMELRFFDTHRCYVDASSMPSKDSTAAPSPEGDGGTASTASASSSDGVASLQHRLVAAQRAHQAVLDVMNDTLEQSYVECERVRRAHVHVVGQIADLRNALNVAEDQTLVVEAQSKRIAELEMQVAHHMEERVNLLMTNHRLVMSSQQQPQQGASRPPSSREEDEDGPSQGWDPMDTDR